jgi:hypothetical protein
LYLDEPSPLFLFSSFLPRVLSPSIHSPDKVESTGSGGAYGVQLFFSGILGNGWGNAIKLQYPTRTVFDRARATA